MRPLLLIVVAGLGLGGCETAHEPEERSAILNAIFSSTVQIKAERPGGIRRFGSGVVLASEGKDGKTLILTAGHVLLPRVDQRIQVVGPFRRKVYAATLVAASKQPDLALIEAHGMRMSTVQYAFEGQIAEDVWIVSFPWGRRRTVANGVVSQIAWQSERVTGNQIPLAGPVTLVDASASLGTSGGGVFRVDDGRLLGIVRGYRTVTVSTPGNKESFKLPVGGETTVIPARDIFRFLETAGFGRLVPPAARNGYRP